MTFQVDTIAKNPGLVREVTFEFTSTILGDSSVRSAIKNLLFLARNVNCDSDLTKVWSNDETDSEAYAQEQFFQVLAGKQSIADFVQVVLLHVMVQSAYERKAANAFHNPKT